MDYLNNFFVISGCLLSIYVAWCFKKLIRNTPPPAPESSIVWTFAIFSGIPIVVLILLGVIPKITSSCVVSGQDKFCIEDAKKEMLDIKKALESSVGSMPAPVLLDDSDNVELTVKQVSIPQKNCKPYVYTDGYTPSAGLILIGKENNWFAVVSSVYDRDRAFRYADKLEKQSKSSYKMEIYAAKDAAGKDVLAVTLGGKLSQSEAEKRVCYAQSSKVFQKDSYVWANDGWGDDLRKK